MKFAENMKVQKIIKILTYFFLIPMAVMVVFNVINSLFRTTYFELYKDMETAKYKWDNPLLALFFSTIILCALYLIWRTKWFGQTTRLGKIAVCFSGILSLIIIFTLKGQAICDGEALSDIAIEFMQENYHIFETGEYLYNYSFQIGMVAILEIVYRLFGIENYLAFQTINVICIMVFIGMLNCITGELFGDKKISKMEAVLSMGALPLFLFSTFVYGDIIGWAFGISAIYCVIRYLKTDKCQWIFSASILFSIGIIAKTNINILVVASVIAVVLNSIYKKKYKALIWIVILVLMSQLGMNIVKAIYVQRADLDEYPPGIPKIAWVAMSMQETDEGGYACGWYNGYNWEVYRLNNYDREQTTKVCIENLKQSLSKLFHEQRYALNFVYKKFTSQWNAPTFQAMITNEWSVRHNEEILPITQFFIYGKGRDILYAIMNIYHFLIFFCTAVCFMRKDREWVLCRTYYILNIFGGFLFHMIWEAQSRYVLGYFILMLPLAAQGLSYLFRVMENKIRAESKRKEIKL